jgi:YfiR/HmsC-like
MASALTLLLVASSGNTLRAGEAGAASLEYPVKASLLLSFAKFAEWPAGSAQSTSPTVSICVLGSDPFGPVLDATVAGRTVGKRPIEVRRYKSVEGIESCNVLFIAASEGSGLRALVARVQGKPVLTVSESPASEGRGCVIRLAIEDNHAAFFVDLEPTKTSHLRLSSHLLSVARSVRDGGTQ